MELYLVHHGIPGQKWGVRRYQNPDGTLTEAGRKRLDKKDNKWIDKHYDKVYKATYKKSHKEIEKYMKKDLAKKYEGQAIGRNYINDLNRKYAEVMNRNVGDIKAPSGRAVQFVAKRGGEVGVYMALADQGYDMSKVKNGVYSSGKVAYKNSSVNVQ